MADYVAPRYRYVPETKMGDFGAEITDLMGLFGRELDPEQRDAVADLSSYDASGNWVALESLVKESRQNGKTAAVVLPVALFDLFELPPDRICWTAHRFKTSRGTFEDLLGSDEAPGILERAPEYMRRIRRINRSHGEEGIYLKSGASLEFLARENSGSGRGLGGKRNVLDEALILKSGLIGGLLPTLAARFRAHVNYASSAAFATDESAHLRTLTERGRYAEPGDRFIHLEWCAPGGWGTNPCKLGDECPHDGRLGCQYPQCELGLDCPHTLNAPNCMLDREEFRRAANHSMGKVRAGGSGISVQYVQDERQAMAAMPREFGRERLGLDEEPPKIDGPNGIDMQQFGKLANSRLLAPGPQDQAAVVVDMPPDRSEVNIALAWRATDPATSEIRPAVMVYTLPGTDTVLDYLTGPEGDRNEQGMLGKISLLELAIQASGPAGSLIKPLEVRGAEAWPPWGVKALSTQECAQAVGHWQDSVKHGKFWHLGQDALQKAQGSATLRKHGDALMWAREDLSNISALIAATLALHRLYTEGDGGGPNVW
jgi:hypothetical protein